MESRWSFNWDTPFTTMCSSETMWLLRSHVPLREPSAATTTVIAPLPSLVATVLPNAPWSMTSLDLRVDVPVYVPGATGLGLQAPEGAGDVETLGFGDAPEWNTMTAVPVP